MEFKLPSDLAGFKAMLHDKAFFMPYTSCRATNNEKIVLGYHAFIFVIEGKKAVSYTYGTKTADPDHFLFLPAANCLMSEKTALNGQYKSLLLFISRQAMTDSLKALPATGGERSSNAPLLISKDAYISNFIGALELLETTHAKILDSQLVLIKVQELLHYLITMDKRLLSYFHSLCYESPEEFRIRQTIEANMQNSLTVAELAFICNMSVSTFKRKFQKIYKDSPQQWLLKARLQKAAELLRKGSNSSEVHNELGYQDQSSFIRSFKKIYGITPKQYQNTY